MELGLILFIIGLIIILSVVVFLVFINYGLVTSIITAGMILLILGILIIMYDN